MTYLRANAICGVSNLCCSEECVTLLYVLLGYHETQALYKFCKIVILRYSCKLTQVHNSYNYSTLTNQSSKNGQQKTRKDFGCRRRKVTDMKRTIHKTNYIKVPTLRVSLCLTCLVLPIFPRAYSSVCFSLLVHGGLFSSCLQAHIEDSTNRGCFFVFLRSFFLRAFCFLSSLVTNVDSFLYVLSIEKL